MKAKHRKFLALFLAAVMLCGGVPLLTAGAESSAEATAKVTKAVLTSADSFVVGGADRGAVYQIALYWDQEVYIADEANYWRQNLQQNGGGCSEAHIARANQIRANISLNGMTVEADLQAGSDHTNSTMVATPSDTEKNKLVVTVRRAENHYGLSDAEDFILQIAGGISMNGVTLSVATVQYCASTKKLTVANAAAEDAAAHVTGLQLENKDGDSCSCGYKGDQWSMVLWTDKAVTPAVNASFYGRHLTVTAASSTDGMSLVGVALRKRILINGKDLDACISASGTGEYNALHIATGTTNAGASFIRISIPKDNQYGFDGQNFEITFLDGIILNGYALAPQKLVYPEKTVPITYDGAGAAAVAADGSSALRFKFTMTCTGVDYADPTHTAGSYERLLTDARISVSGKEYTLVDFGAIVSNESGDNLTLGSVNDRKTRNVPALNLYSVGEDGTVSYTVRVVRVPSAHFDTVLYARSYATVSDGINEWTLYGDTVESCVRAVLTAE